MYATFEIKKPIMDILFVSGHALTIKLQFYKFMS